RADDGRFELSQFEAEVVAMDAEGHPDEPKHLKFARAAADVWEPEKQIGRAIDGDPKSCWSVPTNAVAQPHTAVFVLGEPLNVRANSELRIRLGYQASKAKRAIGRFRLAAARAEEL